MKNLQILGGVILCCAALLAGCTAPSSAPAESLPGSESDVPVSGAEQREEEPAPTASAAVSAPSADMEAASADAAPDAETWEQQAVILTDQIVSCCLQPFDENDSIRALGEREIFQFIATLSRYQEEPGYPYGDAVTITEPDSRNPNLVAHVAESDAQSIVYQLFGVPDWSYDAPDCYDGSVPEYCFNLEAGLPTSPYSDQGAAAERTGDSVVVSFRLTDSDSFAYAAGDGRKDFGQFQAVYRILSEEGKTFLRFQGISPAP